MNKEVARPATIEDLKKLIQAFNESKVDYLLIGGYALFAHGYQRATTDIDFIFPANKEFGLLVKDALMSLPDKAAMDIDPLWFEDGENIRVADEFVVDLMFNACGETYGRSYAAFCLRNFLREILNARVKIAGKHLRVLVPRHFH